MKEPERRFCLARVVLTRRQCLRKAHLGPLTLCRSQASAAVAFPQHCPLRGDSSKILKLILGRSNTPRNYLIRMKSGRTPTPQPHKSLTRSGWNTGLLRVPSVSKITMMGDLSLCTERCLWGAKSRDLLVHHRSSLPFPFLQVLCVDNSVHLIH